MSNIVLSQAKKLAESFGIEGDAQEIVSILKATAFRSDKGEVSDAQLAALLIVAGQYGLNPWTKEIYAFPDKKNGIVPVVGVDGWSRIINEHPQFDGMEFRVSETMVRMPGANVDAPEWMESVIYRKDRSRPTVVREYLDEVYREPFKGQYGVVVGPWQTHTKRFLRHKGTIQGARLAFGFGGIFDQDEAERIVEGKTGEKFMGTVDEVKPEPTPYPADQFAANLPKWREVIESARKTPDDLIQFTQSRNPTTLFTEEQKATLRGIKPVKNAAATDVQPKGEDPAPLDGPAPLAEATSRNQSPVITFAVVNDKLNAAKDMDALNVAADLIAQVADTQQQAELNAAYEARIEEFAGQ